MIAADLIAHITAFLREHPTLPPSRIGECAVGDGGLLGTLLSPRPGKRPRRLRVDTADRLLAWMRLYRETPAAALALGDPARERRRAAKRRARQRAKATSQVLP